MGLNDFVGRCGPQTQGPVRVTHRAGILAIDHRPFVQTEAPQLCGSCGRCSQELPDEAHGVGASPEKGREVHVGRAIGIPVELPVDALTGTFEDDPGTWVPAPQLARSVPVVREKEVLDRVLSIVLSPGQVSGGDGVDPRVVR
jgi:hypothetical protein